MPRRQSVAKNARRAPPIERAVLDNGAAVVLCPRAHLAQSHISVFFGVGSRHETAQLNGITHVLEHMLFRGNRRYKDATALNAAAEDLGGCLDGATYRDHLVFATGCHPSALAQATAIMGELVTTPRYDAMEVERGILREEILEGLNADGDSIDIDNISHQQIFATHPLGMAIEGSLGNLMQLQVPHLEAHRQRFLTGCNAVICVAGPLDPKRALADIARAFAAMPVGHAVLSAVPPAPAPAPSVRYVRDVSSQVDIRLSFRGPPVQDPEHPAMVLLGRLLADGLASRMYAELVDRRGLAYALYAGPTTYADCSLFEFDVSVAPERAFEVVQAILEFIKRAHRLRFSPTELRRAHRRYQYAHEFMADSATDLTSWYGRAALFAVEDAMEALGPAMEKLGNAPLHAIAKRIFQREGMAFTAVGELSRTQWHAVRRCVQDFAFH